MDHRLRWQALLTAGVLAAAPALIICCAVHGSHAPSWIRIAAQATRQVGVDSPLSRQAVKSITTAWIMAVKR
ncbi:hypothetical protein AB0K43_10785 [Kitasatospora sp. NPDC049258]|uniref:hypothetical protein n=1 Tax=Kitasatospora sp. NPDC049258 TaxID=3155394 RepID=UPI0034257296